MDKREKICFIASSGGHLQEISFLFDLRQDYDSFLVTENDEFQKQYHDVMTYYVDKIDRREKHFIRHFLKLIGTSRKIMKQEKPDIIISTGALAAVPMLYLGKLRGKKIIFMESMARVEGKSLSGKLVYPIADLFIVQWESMMKYYPKAIYASRLFGEVKRP